MNHQQRKRNSLLARTFGLIIVALFSHSASATGPTEQTDTECLLNWGHTFLPELFSPAVSGVQFFSPYTYRYYPDTQAYVGVSNIDNHVYYQGPGHAVPQDVGALSYWLGESGCGARPYPVIFIHGIASSAEVWAPYRDYLLNNSYWSFGGIPAYNPGTNTVDINCPSDPNIACTANDGDFYTLNFSDNQHLSLEAQGGEIAAAISAVLEANPGKTKVILAGHSMGGLAAREYLQGLARESDNAAIPYRGDVAKLITVGTPHQGTFWAEQCRNTVDVFDFFGFTADVGICKLLSLPIDKNSVAIIDLHPGSTALNILNDMANHPLPDTVSYVSLIGAGQPTLSALIDFKDGDGIVSDSSQDLVTVAGGLPLQQKAVKIDILFRECGNKMYVPFVGDIGQTHSCEPTDLGVWGEIFRNL
ncbi:MAG: alpha/beta fold hydrolase [Methylobacter sp.]|nr:alpha/beta fold hydrolase [Methylobacter sp.]MDP2097107.1 alpha/beta fold hydrolase [Methylobacter sp.]MDP2427387.1 alpha/beta fold hydrolase [Methylobacter sp.]MDP3053712.1 alpha/beta fold hydrolase [Methylobacter sp.]MDP3362918.1 alpha/beta fold hydrolase [Methylobacter sp.]